MALRPCCLPASLWLRPPLPISRQGARQSRTDTGLAQDVQAKALEYYDRAAESLALTEEAAAKTAALIARIEEGPARVAELREWLEKPRSPTEAAAPAPDASTEQLQAAVNEIRAASTVARDVLDEKDTALSSLKKSGKAIVEEYVARERSLNKITEEARALPSVDIPPAVSQARQAYLGARQTLEQTELDRLRRRNTSYDLLIDLAAVERELAVVELTLIEGEREVLEEALQKRREADARASRWEAEAAIAEVAQLPPAVAAVAEETAALKRELVSVIEREKGRERRAACRHAPVSRDP